MEDCYVGNEKIPLQILGQMENIDQAELAPTAEHM